MLMEVLATAKYGLLMDRRSYGWILTTSVGPFFLLAPFALMAESLVGPGGRFNQPFYEATGYANYLGWLIVPLIALNTMNTVFSNVSQHLHHEKTVGTLERILVSMQFPSALMLGRCLSHGIFLIWFVAVLAGMSFIFLGLRVHVDPLSGAVVVAGHLLAVYGMAFAFGSLFLWLEDAFIVQTALSRVIFGLFTGATFPLSIYPDWVEWLARLIPFTWAFDLERRVFLHAEPLYSILPDLGIFLGLTLAWWALGYACFRTMLDYSRRRGKLGIY